MLEAYICLRSGRTALGAVWLVVGTLKPQAMVAPIVAVVAAFRWRVFAWILGMGLTLALAATVVLGPSIWPSYAEFLTGYVQSFDALSVRPSVMWNIRGTLTLVFGPDVSTTQASAINVAALIIQFIGVAVVAALWFRRWDPGSAAFDLRYAVTLVIGLLASPHLNPHDALVLVPAGAIGYGAVRDRSWGRWVGVVLFASPFFVLITNSISANDLGSGPIRTPVALMILAVVGGLVGLRMVSSDVPAQRSLTA
jgi:hypothetical protein